VVIAKLVHNVLDSANPFSHEIALFQRFTDVDQESSALEPEIRIPFVFLIILLQQGESLVRLVDNESTQCGKFFFTNASH
jgi:hypothetical protein